MNKKHFLSEGFWTLAAKGLLAFTVWYGLTGAFALQGRVVAQVFLLGVAAVGLIALIVACFVTGGEDARRQTDADADETPRHE